jgi:hypothetical protein
VLVTSKQKASLKRNDIAILVVLTVGFLSTIDRSHND